MNRREFLRGTGVAAIVVALTPFLSTRVYKWVNVRDYGARGVPHDDTEAFRRAIAAVAEGGTVYLPPGTYYWPSISSNLSARKRVTIQGAGARMARGPSDD